MWDSAWRFSFYFQQPHKSVKKFKYTNDPVNTGEQVRSRPGLVPLISIFDTNLNQNMLIPISNKEIPRWT